jgi:hypothetical protein
MIKKFYLFENTLFSDLKDNINNRDELHNLIGFDKKYYVLTISNYSWDDYDFVLSFKEKFLVRFLNLEDGIFSWYINVNSNYRQYDTYIDDSEIGFIDRYLTDENLKKLETFLNYLDIDENYDSEILYDVFQTIGDDIFDKRDIKLEISYEWEKAIKHNVDEVNQEIPFNITRSHKSDYTIDLEFSIDKIGNYIQDNKLDVSSIEDFLSNINLSFFTYELDTHYETGYNFDYSDVNKAFSLEIDKLLSEIDIKEPKFEDPTQLKLFNDDDYEELKTKKKYKFDYDFFIQLDIDNLHFAKRAGGKLIAWFESYIFQKNYMKDEDAKKYEFLVDNDIIHPKIVEEYEHLVYSVKYNL